MHKHYKNKPVKQKMQHGMSTIRIPLDLQNDDRTASEKQQHNVTDPQIREIFRRELNVSDSHWQHIRDDLSIEYARSWQGDNPSPYRFRVNHVPLTIRDQDDEEMKWIEHVLIKAPVHFTWGVQSLCTVVMIDLDAPDGVNLDFPSPLAGINFGTRSPWLHWLVVDCTAGNVNTGKEIVKYYGPRPTSIGIYQGHRYLYLVFRQQMGAMDIKVKESSFNRANWNIGDFVTTHNLWLISYNTLPLTLK